MTLFSRTLVALFFFACSYAAFATHNEAGEITICYIGTQGEPLYQVTIITHTNPQSPADRPEFILDWGDNATDTIPRTSSQVMIIAGIEVQRNLYVSTHLYPGPGVYILQYIDPNRVAGVVNMDGSVSVPMCVQTQLIIGVSGNDCTPTFLN
ncbi:MAG TPA: hypothetical protein VHL57_08680, partial [Flavobacteriales bacterium]|nr:hypothetical protein [Flavobacteriales bacterium]